MKKGFVRALWGIHEHEGRRFYLRRTKQDNDIRLMLKNPWIPEFKVYVFGEDNYKMCQELGFDSVLLDKKPIIWDMDTQQFRHKLEVFYRAMEDFDEIVFLDWDNIPIKPIPENFWDVLSKKDPIQANLCQYRRRKAVWRGQVDSRKLPNAAFVYIREKDIAKDMLQVWEDLKRPWSEELVIGKYIDNINGGWKGLDYYWEHYEPHWFSMPRVYWSYPKEKIVNEKDRIFHHFSKTEVQNMLSMSDIKNWSKYL